MDAKTLKAVLVRGASEAGRSSLPILRRVHLKCTNGVLTAESSSLEVSISSSAEVDGTPDFDSCVPAKTLLDLVSVLSGNISLDVCAHSLVVKTESGTTRILSSDPAKFPPMPGSKDGIVFFQLPFAGLAEIATRVAFCASDDDARPVLGGVHIHAENGEIVATATDGFRISSLKFDGVDSQFSANIPAGTLVKAAKMLIADKDGMITVAIDGAAVIFADQWTEIAASTIVGNYPDCNTIIRKTQRGVEFEVSVRELKSAIAQLGVIAESGRLASIGIAETCLRIEVKNQEVGEGTVELPLRNEVKKNEAFGVNLRFLNDALSAVTGEWVKFAYHDKESPFRVTGNNDNHIMVIMPMRVE